MEKEKIKNLLWEHQAQIEFRAKAYVLDSENKKRPRRDVFGKLNKYINDFLDNRDSLRWLTVSGLRGAGKTTVLFQLFGENRKKDVYKLFLSLDQVKQLWQSDLMETVDAYEEIIGYSLEKLDKPLLLFIDEAQYDSRWGIVLKSIFDRSNKVFIIVTGSSALAMNKNTDIARRSAFIKMFPMSFTEYIKLKHGNPEKKGLAEDLKNIIFDSASAKEVFEGLEKNEQQMNGYYFENKIDKNEFSKYLKFGTLPFMIGMNNEALVYDQINRMIKRIIDEDIARMNAFSSEVILKIPSLLYAVSDLEQFNFSKLSQIYDLSRPTVMDVFESLTETEALFRVFPYGSHLNQVKKPSKFLFATPSFRAMYFNYVGNIIKEENSRGRLLEDFTGMYLNRALHKRPRYSLTYDSMKGGADFVVNYNNEKIVIEVGAGKKDFKQIIQTSEKVKAKYSLIISESELELNEELNAVKIPIKYFALM